MDLSNLTIPPELFYSKAPSDVWKPSKSLVKITPVQITKKINKQQKKKVSLNVSHRRKKYKVTIVPELGRIGKIKRVLIKKQLMKKKVLQEKSGNIILRENGVKDGHQLNKIPVKPPTKKEEQDLLKTIREKEESIQKRLFANENFPRKRFKGSSFKFFKSKNVRESETESSDESDDLVPEIRDFSDKPSAPRRNESNEPEISFDPAQSEDESEIELEKTAIVIESLLKELETEDSGVPVPRNESTASEATLESLIAVLEGSPTAQDKTVPPEPKRKNKLMGFGENQLQIDAGQKKFGFVECKECGFSYNTNVPEDEKIHDKHHQAVTSIPRFRGWQGEEALMINDWHEHSGRIVRLNPNHKNINSDFVKEIVGQMEMEFGVQDELQRLHVYLAVYDAKIVGISTVEESVNAKMGNEEKCLRLGVQRLYVRPEFRRKGFAKALLKSIVIMHHKGELLNLGQDVAFSSPTEDGKKLIASVVGSNNFFVFNS